MSKAPTRSQNEADYIEMITVMLKKADERFDKSQRSPDVGDSTEEVNAQDENGWSALFIAAGNDWVEEIRRLVRLGADLNQICPSNGWTALMNAASFGNVRSVIELLTSGAAARPESADGLTAVQIADANHKVLVVRVFRKYFELAGRP